MSTTSRPDRLPLAVARTIGLPYHGRVVADELDLPNSTTIDYPSPADGETHLVRHPRAATPTRTTAEQAADTAAGYQWLDYAILSGSVRMIGGQSLCADQDNSSVCWLYCDADAAWIVHLAFTVDAGTTQTLTVTLRKLFGWCRDADTAMSERTLATYTWTPQDYSGADQSSSAAAFSRRLAVTHSEDGALTVVNVGAYGTGQPWTNTVLTDYPPTGETQYAVGYHDAIEIDISGTGSLTAGSIGTGISATVSHLARAPAMYTESSGGSYLCPGDTWPEELTSNREWTYFYMATPGGAITNIVQTSDTVTTYAYTWSDCGSATNTGATYEYNATETISLAGVTLTAVYTSSWHWEDPAWIADSASGERAMAAYRVHPNVITIYKMDATASTITEALVITSGGDSLDVTGYTDPPNWQSVTWEPGAGTITFVDGGDAGCWV